MSKPRGTLLYPKGTYRAQSFFWRGSDEFKETEHIQKTCATAKDDLTRVRQELEEARKEFFDVEKELNDKEKQAVTLAQSLGSSSSTTAEHAKLRRQIAELTLEIEEIQKKLSDVKAHAQPSTILQLEKERMSYFVCVENLNLNIKQTQEQIREKQLELYELLASEKWRAATNTSIEHQITMRICENVKGSVKSAFEKQNFGDSKLQPTMKKVVNPTDNQALLELLQNRTELEYQCQQIEHQRCSAQIRRRVVAACLLEDLQRLDMALRSLGEEGIDIEGLRRRYLPEGPLSPMKRPRSSGSARGSRTDLLAKKESRSKSDIKRPIRGGRTILSPLGSP